MVIRNAIKELADSLRPRQLAPSGRLCYTTDSVVLR
jgi:hypothetical protein